MNNDFGKTLPILVQNFNRPPGLRRERQMMMIQIIKLLIVYFLHPPVTSLLGPNISLSILFPNLPDSINLSYRDSLLLRV
jgi:hypothetical protein